MSTGSFGPSTTYGMGRRNLSGTGYMLVVVLGISLAPLFFDLGRSSEAPFLFSATWRLDVAICKRRR